MLFELIKKSGPWKGPSMTQLRHKLRHKIPLELRLRPRGWPSARWVPSAPRRELKFETAKHQFEQRLGPFPIKQLIRSFRVRDFPGTEAISRLGESSQLFNLCVLSFRSPKRKRRKRGGIIDIGK